MTEFLLYLIFGIPGAWVVNYLSDVLPVYRKLGPVSCAGCGEELGWRGTLIYAPCRNCGRGPSIRHWIVLVVLPLLTGLAGAFPVDSLGPFLSLVWLVYFGVLVVIDLEHRLILHPVSLVGGLLGLLSGTLSHGLLNTLAGGGAGFGIMLAFYFLGEGFIRLLSRRRGEEIQEVALGFGDVNLAGIMGLLLGWPGVVGGLFFAVLLGGVVSAGYLAIQVLRKEYRSFQALPYGPFLVASIWALFYLSKFVS